MDWVILLTAITAVGAAGAASAATWQAWETRKQVTESRKQGEMAREQFLQTRYDDARPVLIILSSSQSMNGNISAMRKKKRKKKSTGTTGQPTWLVRENRGSSSIVLLVSIALSSFLRQTSLSNRRVTNTSIDSTHLNSHCLLLTQQNHGTFAG